MNILLVYAHPSESSFNAAMKQTAISVLLKNKHQIQISDLYKMHFKTAADWDDFIPESKFPNQFGPAQKIAFEKNLLSVDIKAEQEKILWSDLIIFQFPLWWFSMPAILKGWFDRVMTAGFAYDKGKWFETSPLYGRQARLVITTQAPATSYNKDGLNGDIRMILQPIHHTLEFVGITPQFPFIAYGVMEENEVLRKKYLEHYEKSLQDLENIPIIAIPKLSEYDDSLQLKK